MPSRRRRARASPPRGENGGAHGSGLRPQPAPFPPPALFPPIFLPLARIHVYKASVLHLDVSAGADDGIYRMRCRANILLIGVERLLGSGSAQLASEWNAISQIFHITFLLTCRKIFIVPAFRLHPRTLTRIQLRKIQRYGNRLGGQLGPDAHKV